LLPATRSGSSASVERKGGRGRKDREALWAALAYLAITLAFTWPLARGLTHDIPGDFGDPLLNAWILAWDASHLGRGWWNANIFHPHPLALAYSEHLLPQALLILPIHLAIRNPILSYNLVFLSTFVLSGLGMFLLAREITGSRPAAFVAGVAYAFAPYRVTSIPHLQVLSSQWLPFALYGFRTYFDGATSRAEHAEHAENTGTLRVPRAMLWALCGGTAAWIAQNLSCGYYFLFFSPVVLAYLAWELTTRSLWRDRRIVVGILFACAAVAAVTAAVMLPYLELRRLGFNPRSLEETTKFSADVYAYATADPNLHLWGWLQAWPKPEGALFPGLTIAALAIMGSGFFFSAKTPANLGGRPDWTAAEKMRSGLFFAALILLAALLLGWTVRLPGLKIVSFPRAATIVGILFVAALVASPRLRAAAKARIETIPGFLLAVALFGVTMSWGPSIQARGRTIAASNLYSLFYAYVPGFDGLRSPARFAMLVAFALAALAAVAVARRNRGLALAAAAAMLLESAAVPIPVNQNAIDYRQPRLTPLPPTVAPFPEVYDFVASNLPADAALIELPLGEPAFDVRYMLYSTRHWRRLVNGYSGGAPADYGQLDLALQDALERPDRAWAALTATGASYAIVHEGSYAAERGQEISNWLRAHGAREIATFQADRIFRVR